MATHPDYPGATSREKRGKTVWRYRANRHAPEVTLPGQPGEPDFTVAYHRAVTGNTKAAIIDLPIGALPKTFAKAARRLETTMEWLSFDPETRKNNTRHIERFMEMKVEEGKPLTWGQTPVEYLDADRLRAIVEALHADTPAVAKHMLNAIKKLLWVAVDLEKWIKPQDDPSLSIRVRLKGTPNASKAWPMNIREKFEARHPIGSAARTCYALAFWLGNRRSDVATLEWDHLVVEEIELFDGSLVQIEAFDFNQMKNRIRTGGAEMFIPIVDKLARDLAPLDRTKGGTVLKTRTGTAYSEKSLTNHMQDWTKQAGIPAGYTMHGLRKSFGTYIAECGIQARGIMDALGHSTMATADIYVQEANKKRMMVDVANAINNRENKRDQMRARGHLRIVA